MKDKKQVLDGMLACGMAAVVRADSADKARRAIEAVLEGGVNVIEVTFTVPRALELIEELARTVSEDVILGAGTVLNPETAAAAISAGAQFIVSPNTNLATVEVARSHKTAVIPGALTPTEVVTAWQAGADLVKIFPANVMGPGYLKDLHGPLPQIPLMPTGGVDLDTAREWLEHGAAALGVGSALVDKKLIAAGNFAEITARARRFREIIDEYRNGG